MGYEREPRYQRVEECMAPQGTWHILDFNAPDGFHRTLILGPNSEARCKAYASWLHGPRIIDPDEMMPHTQAGDVVRAWLADPAPKLAPLCLELRIPEGPDLGMSSRPGPAIDLTMRHVGPLGAFAAGRRVKLGDFAPPVIGASLALYKLVEMHDELVELLRGGAGRGG